MMRDQNLDFVLARVPGHRETWIVALLSRIILVHAHKLTIGKAPLVLRRIPIGSLITGGVVLGDLLTFIEQVGFQCCRIATIPKPNVQKSCSVTVAMFVEDVANRDPPV